MRSAWGFHPREDQIFCHGLAALNALHLGIGVDMQILAEEPQVDPWPAIGQTHHNDRLAVESQRLLLNRDQFLLVVSTAAQIGLPNLDTGRFRRPGQSGLSAFLPVSDRLVAQESLLKPTRLERCP